MALLHTIAAGEIDGQLRVVMTAADGSRVEIPVEGLNAVLAQAMALATAEEKKRREVSGGPWQATLLQMADGFELGTTDNGRVVLRCHLASQPRAALDLSIGRSDALGLAQALKDTAESLDPSPSAH